MAIIRTYNFNPAAIGRDKKICKVAITPPRTIIIQYYYDKYNIKFYNSKHAQLHIVASI